jgi:hypothetical protein
MLIESFLRENLLTMARACAAARGLTLKSISRKAVDDHRFFDRLIRKDGSFTVRKYDEIMGWFSDPANWPAGTNPPPAPYEIRRTTS